MLSNIVLQFGQLPYPPAQFWFLKLVILVIVVQLVVTIADVVLKRAGRRTQYWPVQSVEYGGSRFNISAQDHDTKAWLIGLFAQRLPKGTPSDRPIPLVRFREQFRHLIQIRPVGGLVSCLLEADPDVRKVAVWLLGRCGATSTRSALRVLQSSRDPSIRRQIAIALKRIGNWQELQLMVIRDRDESDHPDRPWIDGLPFGFCNAHWCRVKEEIRDGDELWKFCSPAETWENLHGRAGYALIRDGKVIACVLTMEN